MEQLCSLVVDLNRDAVVNTVRTRLEVGEDAMQILAECRRGMSEVGDRFQQGNYYLAELLLSAEIFKEAAAILEPHLAGTRSSVTAGKVVLATLRGDIHDLGKNILATLLRAQGFEVYDLGVDVPPARVVEAVREASPDFVGFSALITTAFPSMKEAADLLRKEGLRNKTRIMLGGGVTTRMVMDFVGADFQTTDAMEGVIYCINAMGVK